MVKCKLCNNEFEKKVNNQIFCSKKCNHRFFHPLKNLNKIKNCKICNNQFIDNTSNNNKLCCSFICSNKKHLLNNKNWRQNNKELHALHNRNWVNQNKHKKKCQDLFYRDLKKNPHLYPKECCICEVKENIEFHHPNYDFPYSVYPLCKIHHMQLHKNIRGLNI